MPTLTIRKLPEGVVERLKEAAARNNRSMEQEVRELLEERYLTREEVLARIQARWAALPRVTAEELNSWRESGRP